MLFVAIEVFDGRQLLFAQHHSADAFHFQLQRGS